jgi:hypothetical protein
MEGKKMYRFEVKVSGWMSRFVEANSLEEARDNAAEIDLNQPIATLQWKEVTVEDYTD